MNSSSQHILASVTEGQKVFQLLVIYSSNCESERTTLYSHFQNFTGPLVSMGDYNAIRCPTESSNGCRNLSSMLAFDSWIKSMGWSEHIVQGPWFTWQNGSIARRLDRVLNDDDWQIEFPQSQVLILPPFISDHSGLLLNTDVRLKTLPKSFKFFKMWCSHPSYDHIVQEKWKMAVTGSPLIRICKKLQFIKGELKKLNRRVYSDISNRVIEAELEMTNAQVNVLHDPSPSNLEASAAASAHWSSLKADEESFFRQKARATWITEGDKNTAYFHRSMKARHARNFISVIKKDDVSRLAILRICSLSVYASMMLRF
ncbi:hypothetical protein LINPERHAP2_LOCUS7324 [Linum perenne]